MKHFSRFALALLLAASMVCGMLMPAFAWIPEQTYLRSPDGVYWFDMTKVEYWPSEGDYNNMMIYSQDGVVWFSEEGLQYYKGLSYWPDETWQEHMLDYSVDGSSFYTTDYGKMWIWFENGVIDYSDWMDWLDVWPPETINLNDASQHLYRNDDSFVMCVEPLDDHSNPIGILEAGFSKLGKYVSEVRFNVVHSDIGDNLQLSTDGENWATSIPVSAWENTDNYVKNLLGAGVSFDPYTGVVYQYAATYNGQFTLRRAADAGDCPALVQRTLYLRADSDCSVSLELTCDNTTRCTYGMMSLQSIPAEDREISQNTPLAGLPESAGAMLIVGEAEDASRSYTPIDIPAGTTVSFTDANNNYVFDSADECTGPLTLAPYTVQAQSSGEATVRLRAGRTYSIPCWFWMEGQDADAVPDSTAFRNSDARFNLQIRQVEEEPEHIHTYNSLPVWTFADDFSSATATFTCDTCGEAYICDASLEVTVVREATCTSDRIIDYTVSVALGNCVYTENRHNYIMDNTATGHSWTEEPVYIDETYHGIICENCGELEGGEEPHSFSSVTVYPTCQHGGYKTVSCSVCGYSYITDEKPAIDHEFDYVITCPTCEAAGRRYARCAYCGLVEDTILPPTGHNYGAPAWDWADDYSRAAAVSKCQNALCIREIVSDAVIDATVIREASCTADQIVVYTATADLDGTTYSDTTREITIPDTALGHDFGEWVVTKPAAAGEDGEETRICTRCGETETRALVSARFSVTSGRARRGETVQVAVDVSNNPGIVAAMLRLEYDPQVLTLTAVDNGDVFGEDAFQSGGDYSAVPFTVFWQDALALEDNTANGTLVTFTFDVSDNAPLGETPVSILCEQDSTFNHQLQDVVFAVDNGSVTVFDRVPGDADGDGVLDLKDVADLTRYLAGGWDVEVDERNADVDGDGKLTLKDVVLLRRYLAGGWGVELQ